MSVLIRLYQILFLLSFSNVLIALWCIFDPAGWAVFSSVTITSLTTLSMFRIWGGTLLGVHMLYLPGLIDPIRYQWSNWISIALKFWMSAIFITSGFDFWNYAAWDFCWGFVLLTSYSLALFTRKEVRFLYA